MQIAISINCLYLIPFAEGKADFRHVSGRQRFTLVALLGLEGDPLNIVLRQHGMLH